MIGCDVQTTDDNATFDSFKPPHGPREDAILVVVCLDHNDWLFTAILHVL